MQWTTECVNHCFAEVAKQDEWRRTVPHWLLTVFVSYQQQAIFAFSPAFMVVWVVVDQVKINQNMLVITSPTYLIFFVFPCHCCCQRVNFFPVIEAWEMCCQSKVEIISFATCTYTCIMHHIAMRDLRCFVPDHPIFTSSCVFHRRFVVVVNIEDCAQILQLCARFFSCVTLLDRDTECTCCAQFLQLRARFFDSWFVWITSVEARHQQYT